MSEIVSGTTIESLQKAGSAAQVVQVMTEVQTATPNMPVEVFAAFTEQTLVQPNQPVRTHAVQIEHLWTKNNPPVQVQAVVIEVLVPVPTGQTLAAVPGAYVEVLRSVTYKKRPGPVLVVAS